VDKLVLSFLTGSESHTHATTQRRNESLFNLEKAVSRKACKERKEKITSFQALCLSTDWF
jgi:hypothetical protein